MLYEIVLWSKAIPIQIALFLGPNRPWGVLTHCVPRSLAIWPACKTSCLCTTVRLSDQSTLSGNCLAFCHGKAMLITFFHPAVAECLSSVVRFVTR